MSMIGKRLGHYTVSTLIGRGGMGEVYQAKDQKLGRDVAIKVLPEEFAKDADRVARFQREAKLLASLNHPNIAAIHGLEEADGTHFLVLELIEGDTLADQIKEGPIPVEECLKLAQQVAEALEAAHEHGTIHRDLKPANIKITPEGRVKVLDFGLAKTFAGDKQEMSLSDSPTLSEAATQKGVILGTTAYMSPEQAEGKSVDARSDIFSFGAVLYEALTGKRAFQGESYISTLSAVLRGTPTAVRKLRAAVPAALERIVNRCLEKNRDARYATAAEIRKDLSSVQSQFAAGRMGFGFILRRPQFAVTALVLVIALALMIGWFWIRSSRIRWARTVALPEIARLKDAQQPLAALQLIRRAESYIEGDLELKDLRQNFTLPLSVVTDPPGADFYIRDYVKAPGGAGWIHLGRTPIEAAVIPIGILAYRITKTDFETVEGTIVNGFSNTPAVFQAKLSSAESNPAGMVLVPAQSGNVFGITQILPIPNLEIEEYWIDKYEVTNQQFKEFVDHGAYEKKEYWKHPFIKEGRIITWEEGIDSFRDTTGRAGPASWEFGTYPQGQADFPVGGVSWYEAAAYAEFAGKSLPTVHHWVRAAGDNSDSTIVQVSNFTGNGPTQGGSHQGLSPYGSYDMAGNVKEWCWNPSGEDRYILGGAWSDPSYQFYAADKRSPMHRDAVNGFRCAKYKSPPTEEMTGTVQFLLKDRRGDKPATDEIFQVYKSIHQYNRGDLKPVIESVDDDFPYWRVDKVSFQAAYGNERVFAYLYLPKNATPPYQTVVHFPGAYALFINTSHSLNTGLIDFIIRSGRALMFPIYKGTYERLDGNSFENYVTYGDVWRDAAIKFAKDLGRSIDYLETRPEIDQDKLAYYGFSMGASEGPRLITLEPRIKAGLLFFGGAYEREWPAEIDSFNFAPHVQVPILMVGARYDAIFSLEASQVPLFKFLGTPEADKQHSVKDVAHGVLNADIIKEALEWLDRYLGPVKSR